MFTVACFLVLAYGLGSIPFGLLLTRLANLPDIRSQGSCNIGVTNVLRVGGKYLALGTLICDILKGVITTIIAQTMIPEYLLWVAFVTVLGHVFPLWLKFSGGKGVATFFGVMLITDWQFFLISAGIWVFILALTRKASLASILAVLGALISSLIWYDIQKNLLMIAFWVLILFTHRENIKRLLKRTELPLKYSPVK